MSSKLRGRRGRKAPPMPLHKDVKLVSKKGQTPVYVARASSLDDGNGIRYRESETGVVVDNVQYDLRVDDDNTTWYPTYTLPCPSSSVLTRREISYPIVKGDHKTPNRWQHSLLLSTPLSYVRPFQLGETYHGPSQFTLDNPRWVGVHSNPYWCVSDGASGEGYYDPLQGLPSFAEYNPDWGDFVYPPEGLAGLTESALNSTLPRIRAGLSLVNSLLELKDFKGTFQRIANVVKIGLASAKSFSALSQAAKTHLTLREISRTAASNYLEWSFNLAPFMSDVTAIYKQLRESNSRILRLLAQAGKVQRRHHSRVYLEYPSSLELSHTSVRDIPEPSGSGIIGSVTSTLRRIVYTEPSTFHVEVGYRYSYSSFQVEYAQLLGLLDSFGVNINPATIWRAIPFSFLIDWVVDVGRFLDRLKLRNMDPTLNIEYYLWSISRKRLITATNEIGWGEAATEAPRAVVGLPMYVETTYRRENTIPSVLSSIGTTGVDSSEFTLASALLLSRKRKHQRSQARNRLTNSKFIK